jgi:hypothetical protein
MPAKGQKMVKHDWASIRAAYVEGCVIDGKRHEEPTLSQVAGIFKAAEGRVREVAGKEGWTQQRGMYRTKVEQARREQRADNMASKGAEFDSKVLEASEAAIALLRRELNHHVALAKNDPQARVSLSVLRDLMAGLEKAQKIGRISLGDTSEEVGLRGGADLTFKIVGGGMLDDDPTAP